MKGSVEHRTTTTLENFSQQGLASCRILEEDLADVLVSVHLLLPGYLFYG